MHRSVLALMLTFLAVPMAVGQVPSQTPDPNPPLQKFEGNAPLTTPSFTVGDQWEIRWIGIRGMNVSVLGADNTVVAGASGLRGSLYLPKGGTYHLQIDCDPLPPETSQQPSNENKGASGFEQAIGGGDDNPNTNAAPHQLPPNFARMFARRKYQVDVVQMSSPAAQTRGEMPNYALPVLASNYSLESPTSNTPPAPATPAAPPAPGLTSDQTKAVVLIKGDHAEGTGFMIKTPSGPVVITNIHVIANNPNLKITTSTGAFVNVLSQKGASDRDLAMLAIEDKGYSYLQMAPDISTVVQTGDEVITPGNSQGGEVMLNTTGKVLGIGPERVEIDNPIYHGNSGGPVFHTKSGKVLGVVTEAEKVNMSNDLDKASFASRNSAISGTMRYFALRLDTVAAWIPIDPRRFQIETTFLDQFHEQSRRLDSFLNTPDKPNGQASSGDNGNDAKLYLQDEKIVKAMHDFEGENAGSDIAQHIQAVREFLFALKGIADTNLDQIGVKENFYGFDQERAQDEMAYRKALRTELDSWGDNVERVGQLPRSNN